MTCPKCKHVNKLQQSEVNPLRLPKDVTEDYIRHFKEQTHANPKDTNALFGMGLVYMGLKNYELAQKNLEEAVKLSPLEPDIYYYFALSLFEGHNPKHINPNTADRIEEWLHTASNRQEKRKYLVLLMVLRQCHYVDNGLQVKGMYRSPTSRSRNGSARYRAVTARKSPTRSVRTAITQVAMNTADHGRRTVRTMTHSCRTKQRLLVTG